MGKLQSYVVAIAKDSKDDLCSKCTKCVADCKSDIVVFGNGEGDDNVIMCISFTAKSDKDIILGEIHIK